MLWLFAMVETRQYLIIPTLPNWNDAYPSAMCNVYQEHSNDLDVCCLFVEAMRNRALWQLWDLSTGQPTKGADTVEAMNALERVFADNVDAAAA